MSRVVWADKLVLSGIELAGSRRAIRRSPNHVEPWAYDRARAEIANQLQSGEPAPPTDGSPGEAKAAPKL
jgi:hypothetical protein